MDETPAAPPRDGPDREHSLDGPALARALRAGADALAMQADALNAINVFPVPDGDTGTNMALTMRAAVDGIIDEASIASVMDALARASQARPHFHGGTQGAFRERPRFEHVLLLRRAPALARERRPGL